MCLIPAEIIRPVPHDDAERDIRRKRRAPPAPAATKAARPLQEFRRENP